MLLRGERRAASAVMVLCVLALGTVVFMRGSAGGGEDAALRGYVAVLLAVVVFGSFSILIKSDAVTRSAVDPTVFQLYMCIGILATKLILLAVVPFRFSWWGVGGAVLWTGAQVSFFLVIRAIGVAVAGALVGGLTISISFLWGVAAFGERVRSPAGCAVAIAILTAGVCAAALAQTDAPVRAARVVAARCAAQPEARPGRAQRAPHGRSSVEGAEMTAADAAATRAADSDLEQGPVHEASPALAPTDAAAAEDKLRVYGEALPPALVLPSSRGGAAAPSPPRPGPDAYAVVPTTPSAPSAQFPGASSPVDPQATGTPRGKGGGAGKVPGPAELGERPPPARQLLQGVLWAVAVGVCNGSMMAPYSFYARAEGTRAAFSEADMALGYQPSFGLGAVLGAGALFLARAGTNRLRGAPAPLLHPGHVAVPGVLTGVFWAVGNICATVGTSALGSTVGFPLTQAALLVIGLWGILYFREITAGPAVAAFAAAACLVLGGAAVLATSGPA